MGRFAGVRAAVTGGAGFIGSHLVERLVLEGASEVRVLDDLSSGVEKNLADAMRSGRVHVVWADLCDQRGLADLLRGADVLFHLAAAKHHPFRIDPQGLFRVNVEGTFRVLEAAAEYKVEQTLFASSLYAYGIHTAACMDEETPLRPHTLYGATKSAGEQLLHSYLSRGLPRAKVLRYFFVYGPRLFRGHYRNAFVARSIARLSRGEPPEVFGDGLQTLDYIYVDDAIEATLLAALHPASWLTLNIGTGVGRTILEMSRQLIALSDSGLEPIFGLADESAGTRRVANVTRLRETLGFHPQIDLIEGLRRSMEWLATSGDEEAEPMVT